MDIHSYFKLLRFSLELEDCFEEKLSPEDWRKIFEFSFRQALLGVVYNGVKRLQGEFAPPFETAVKWTASAEKVRGMNKTFYSECKRLTELFEAHGRKTLILKGQANSLLYPDCFSRQPGDIDIFLDGGKENVIALLEKIGMMSEKAGLTAYHHVHLPENEKGVEIEVHFRPSSGFHNTLLNNKFQKILTEKLNDRLFNEYGFYVPSLQFALLMQLVHIERHFFEGGVGLRQITDYYFLLKKSSIEERKETAGYLKTLCIRRFTAALMYVLKVIFRLEDGFMLCGADEKYGKKFLDEVITGGNFGWYSGKNHYDNVFRKFLKKRRQNLRLFFFSPPEIMAKELDYYKLFFKNMPKRIRYRTLSLENIKKDENN